MIWNGEMPSSKVVDGVFVADISCELANLRNDSTSETEGLIFEAFEIPLGTRNETREEDVVNAFAIRYEADPTAIATPNIVNFISLQGSIKNLFLCLF